MAAARSWLGWAAVWTITSGPDFPDQREDAGAVADVELVMDETGDGPGQPLLVPAGVALRAEEDGALVVVDAVDLQARLMEIQRDLRADQPRRTRNQTTFHVKKVTAAREPVGRPLQSLKPAATASW